MISPPDEKVRQKLLEAIEYGEVIALHTIDNDVTLKESLFKLARLYHVVSTGEDVALLEIQNALEEFYAIDPEFIERINNVGLETFKKHDDGGVVGEVQTISKMDG